MVEVAVPTRHGGVHELLDGGGVRALSTLHILKNIMEAIDRENPPKPCDFFDMIGGTGSGGCVTFLAYLHTTTTNERT